MNTYYVVHWVSIRQGMTTPFNHGVYSIYGNLEIAQDQAIELARDRAYKFDAEFVEHRDGDGAIASIIVESHYSTTTIYVDAVNTIDL